MKKFVLAPIVIVCAFGAYYAYQGMMRRPADEVVLPDFEALGPGPRAPTTALFGLEVGRSTYADVQALAATAGLDCKDTSARALMKQMRAMKKAEHEAKLAKGEKVDAVSSASSKKKSPMEKNPQVRYSCEGSNASTLSDAKREPVEGRVLVVIDSPEHPIRHASFRRNHTTKDGAWRDATTTLARFTKTYGEPTLVKLPLPAEPGPDIFPRYTQSRYEWSFADLKVMLNVMGTPRGVDVLEAIEVPWPVRADAPTLPPVTSGALANAP